MSESKVVRYEPSLEWLCIDYEDPRQVVEMLKDSDGTYVTHADYKALEDELAALRGKVRELVEADIAFNRESLGYFVVNAASDRRRLALEALS